MDGIMTSSAIPPLTPQVLEEPMIYLSELQHEVIKNNAQLRQALGDVSLPAWVPHRIIAQALGYGTFGIRNAMKTLNGRPYLWATELENVHSLWQYDEPTIEIDGQVYRSSESYYHTQKPCPFDAEMWDGQRDAIMDKAVRAKLSADPSLKRLLMATRDHPLVSIKNDEYWGFHPYSGGSNRLAQIWMEIRNELVVQSQGTMCDAAVNSSTPHKHDAT